MAEETGKRKRGRPKKVRPEGQETGTVWVIRDVDPAVRYFVRLYATIKGATTAETLKDFVRNAMVLDCLREILELRQLFGTRSQLDHDDISKAMQWATKELNDATATLRTRARQDDDEPAPGFPVGQEDADRWLMHLGSRMKSEAMIEEYLSLPERAAAAGKLSPGPNVPEE